MAARMTGTQNQQESRAAARKSRDAEAILFRLKFVNDIIYKCSQASIKQGFIAPNTLAHCVVLHDAVFSTTAMYGVPCHYSYGRRPLGPTTTNTE